MTARTAKRKPRAGAEQPRALDMVREAAQKLAKRVLSADTRRMTPQQAARMLGQISRAAASLQALELGATAKDVREEEEQLRRESVEEWNARQAPAPAPETARGEA